MFLDLSTYQKIEILLVLFVVMPVGIAMFWMVGVKNDVPGSSYIMPILGYGFNIILILICSILWFRGRRLNLSIPRLDTKENS